MKILYSVLLICPMVIAQDMDVFAQQLNQLQTRLVDLKQTANQLGVSQGPARVITQQPIEPAPQPLILVPPTPTAPKQSPTQPTKQYAVFAPVPATEIPTRPSVPLAPKTKPVAQPQTAILPVEPVVPVEMQPKVLPGSQTLPDILEARPRVPMAPKTKQPEATVVTVLPQPVAPVIEPVIMPVQPKIAKIIAPVAAYSVIKISDPNNAFLTQVGQRQFFDPFKYVMGITEADFKKLSALEQLKYIRSPLGQNIVGDPNAPGFIAGTFKEYSIKELRNRYAQKDHGLGCKFFVQEAVDRPYDNGKGAPNWFLSKFDIGAMQAAKENRGAVFQVASNFNGLEGSGNPAAGIMPYLTEGLYVQGEAAAVSAMPGLIYRMYFVPQPVNDILYFGQLQRQLNFLSEIPAIPIVNGYPQNVNLGAFQNLSAQAYDDFVKKVHIGFHEGIQVTSGLGALRGKGELLGTNGFKAVKIDDANQHVSQVLTAAFNLAGTTDPQYRTIARILLDAAYEGTIKSAYVNNKEVVYLTLVGGGVFKNDPEWIIDAIMKALNDFVNKGTMEIVLMIYALPGDQAKTDALRKKLLSYTRTMNGSYLQFKTDGIYRLDPV